MTSHPMPSSFVTEVQRERAVDYLQQAFAAGVIDSSGFEDRVAVALTASSRVELNSSLKGIARVMDHSQPMSSAPLARSDVADRAQNLGAGFAHLSGYVFPFFLGPVVVKAVARPGSRLWLEAGRALSFQLTAITVAMVVGTMMVFFNVGSSFFILGCIGWLISTMLLAVRAFQGQNSTGSVERLLIFKPAREPRGIGQ